MIRTLPFIPPPFILLLALLLALPAPALAGHDDDDHERARAALQAGEVVPLQDVLDVVNARFDGTLLEVELEQKHGRWVYEIKLLTRPGAVVKLHYDARTKELLSAKGRGLDAAERKAGQN